MASFTGGYGCDFVNPPPDSLECSICLMILRDPHVISCCGNHFCHSCIAKIQANNKPCPLCNENGFTTFLHKGVAREVNALMVYCTMKNKGCDWQGELGKVEQHVNPGASGKGCVFIMVECKYRCGGRFEQPVLTKHEYEECPKRPIEVQMAFLMKRIETQDVEIQSLKANSQTEIQSLKRQVSELQAEIVPLKQKNGIIPSPPTPPFYFSITRYKHYKDNNLVERSPPFYSHPGGYKIKLNIYANGFATGKGTHLSLYISVLRGEFDDQLQWPFKRKITVQMYNFNQEKWAHTTIIHFHESPTIRAMDGYSSASRGYPTLIANDLLQQEYSSEYEVVRFKVLKVEL